MTDICSGTVRGGRRPSAALASMVLPVPGGPERRILWRPAMAIVRALLANS